jgi:hypothetical protein
MTAWSKTQTELLVERGAPSLPEGYTYRLDIKHPSLTEAKPLLQPASVTARIGCFLGDEWLEVSRFTEVTRADLAMASVAACKHAWEGWGIHEQVPSLH